MPFEKVEIWLEISSSLKEKVENGKKYYKDPSNTNQKCFHGHSNL